MTLPNADDTTSELQGEIWSKSLKYFDLVYHYKPETSEHYYMYRDSKASELTDIVMNLIAAQKERWEAEARQIVKDLSHEIANYGDGQIVYVHNEAVVPVSKVLAAYAALDGVIERRDD